MNSDPYKLERFVQAQEGVYPVALAELRRGCKRSHWMWYIFPQLKHLGRSYNAKYYGIADLDEARAYLAHHLLGPRLREAAEALLSLSTSDAREVMGPVDALKLRSSMTLFDLVDTSDVFARVLAKYYHGLPDTRTIDILK